MRAGCVGGEEGGRGGHNELIFPGRKRINQEGKDEEEKEDY